MIELRIAARASISEIADTPANNVINIIILETSFLELKNKKIANGILNAIEAAVIFLLPANPFIAITLRPSLGYTKEKS